MEVGDLFLTYAAVATASAQKLFCNPAYDNFDHADSIKVWLIHSDTPFCSGVLGTVSSWCIPLDFK